MKVSHTVRSILLAVLVLMLVSACATNPVTGRPQLALSESWGKTAGAEYHQEILKQYQIYDDPQLQNYIDEIGQRLVAKSHRPDLPFKFTLLDSPEVNAFALPGGYVYVTRGIMAYMSKESHLAGVIGHEIGHVTARHGAQRAAQQQAAGIAAIGVAIATGSNELAQASQLLGGALMSGYGREQELQSDRLGAEYIAKNNYDVDEMLGVIGILKNQELFAAEKAAAEGREHQSYHGLFSTHPNNDKRLKEVIKAADKFRDISQPIPDDGRFLRMTNGMAFGSRESQGIIRGNKFYHKDLDLFVEFPDQWQIVNQATQLLAVSPDSTQGIIIKHESVQSGTSPSQYLSNVYDSFRNGQNISNVNGNAYGGLATLTDAETSQQADIRVSSLYRGNQNFIIQGLGKDNLPDREFYSVVQAVRGLKSNEKKLATGNHIQLVTAKRGDTFAKLAQSSGLTDYAEAQLRLINNMYPSGEPTAGQQIKIIK